MRVQQRSESLIGRKQTASPDSRPSLSATRGFKLIKRNRSTWPHPLGISAPSRTNVALSGDALRDVKDAVASGRQTGFESDIDTKKGGQMSANNLILVGSVRPVSASDCLPEDEKHEAAKALRGVSDWIALCQRCATQTPQREADNRPSSERPTQAVIVPFKTRQGG